MEDFGCAKQLESLGDSGSTFSMGSNKSSKAGSVGAESVILIE